MTLLSDFKKNRYGYLYLLMMAFILLRMIRGIYGGVSSQGGAWNVIQLLFIVVGFGFFFSKYSHHHSAVNILFLYSLMAMLASLMHLQTRPFAGPSGVFYYFAILCAPSVLLIFYCVALKKDINDFSLIIKIFFYIFVFLFYFSMSSYRVVDTNDEYISFSDIYFPITILPLVLYYTRPSLSFIPFLSVLVGIIVSGKRGGLVIVAVVAFAYFFFGKKRKIEQSVFLLILFAIIIYVSFFLINYLDSAFGMHTIDRMLNSAEDGGSGRINRWSQVSVALGSSSIFELFLGHGFNTMYDLVGGRAHNDFLEVFYNYGFIALFLYVLFFVSLVFTNIKQYRRRYPRAVYMTCSILVSLILALVSFFIVDPTYVLGSMFTTGLFLGDWMQYCRNNRKQVINTIFNGV